MENAHLITPLQKMDFLSSYKKNLSIFFKRDDLNGRFLGGNKIRMLIYLSKFFKEREIKTVVLSGHVGSNFIFATAVFCKSLNLKAKLIIFSNEFNLKIETKRILDWLGAEAVFIDYNNNDIFSKTLAKKKEDALIKEILEKESNNTFVIPEGGGLECISAYIEAFQELNLQIKKKNITDFQIHLPVGSGSTLLGLYIGSKIYNESVEIVGVSISYKEARIKNNLGRILNNNYFNQFDCKFDLDEIKIVDKWVGEGYGKSTEASKEAIELVLKTESILLDNTYTAKGICEILFGNNTFLKKNIVFLHTGGMLQSIKNMIDP